MRKGGNISIKLTNILKQTKDCCNKKKCPKGSKRCKPKKKKRKDDDEGMFGGMPNIRPTSRAIPMPQSVMNNITPVPNVPMPRQLPTYSQFRRPHAMYQRNDRPLQVQQGRGVRQPERQPLMVSSGIQTARRQALKMHQLPPKSVQRPPISVQTATREEGVVATQAPKQLKFNPPPQPRAIPELDKAPPKRIFTKIPPRPIFKLGQVPPPRLTLTRGVRSDREIRGSIGTSDQPFNAEAPTPNILDYEGILMRNAEEDRRLAQRRRVEMREIFKSTRALVQLREKRIEGTIEDIGQGTPRVDKEERSASPNVLFSDVTEDESDEDTPQEESVKQLIAEEVRPQGRPGFVDDRIAERERRDIDDEPFRPRRGRPTREDIIERVMREDIAERRKYLEERGEDTSGYTSDEIFRMPDEKFNFSDRTAAGASFV